MKFGGRASRGKATELSLRTIKKKKNTAEPKTFIICGQNEAEVNELWEVSSALRRRLRRIITKGLGFQREDGKVLVYSNYGEVGHEGIFK